MHATHRSIHCAHLLITLPNLPLCPSQVRLVSPAGGWQAVWSHQLLPGERALSVAAVRLTDQTTGATVPLLAVGAALPAGELWWLVWLVCLPALCGSGKSARFC